MGSGSRLRESEWYFQQFSARQHKVLRLRVSACKTLSCAQDDSSRKDYCEVTACCLISMAIFGGCNRVLWIRQ